MRGNLTSKAGALHYSATVGIGKHIPKTKSTNFSQGSKNELRHQWPLNLTSNVNYFAIPNMDLCHLCPIKVGIGKHIYKQNFVLSSIQAAQAWQFSRLRGVAQWQTHLETGFCPHHQALAWLAPSMWFGIVWKQARFLGHISSSGWKEMRHLCGILLWLGRLRDVGRYEGLAPSMWAFPAWFWRMSGTCAIYVPERQLDVEEKKWGANQRRRLQQIGPF